MVGTKTACLLRLCRFNMLAKTRQTWKLDGMNSLEYELVSRQYLPLYANITVNIGTEKGLKTLIKAPPPQAAAKDEPIDKEAAKVPPKP